MRLTPSSPSTREFRERGFVVVKGLLPADAVERYVVELEQLSGRTRAGFDAFRVRGGLAAVIGRRRLYRGWTLPDGVSKRPGFWELALLPGLVAVVRELFGRQARYLQHTDLHVGFSAVNWHRDSVNRALGETGDWDEWEEPYRLARVGFYFQTHAESRFSLGLVPGSHRRGGLLGDAELAALERFTSAPRQALSLLRGRDPLAGRAEWVEAESGDAVIFDPRILHSGSFISGPKYSAFLAYGVPGRHFARHRHYYRHVRTELGYTDLDPAFAARLDADGLLDVATARPEAIPGAYRPGRLQQLLGRHVRPGASAG
jgi:hypothetical protein